VTLTKRNLNQIWYSGLALLAAATAYMVFWHLEQAERSGYYAMVATSMSRGWHNAFFGAADPAGMLALDKIPGSYWIPALMVRLIGFHNAAVVAPNGIATVIAVIVMAFAGKRLGQQLLGSQLLGSIATGLLSGLLFATTPIIIAVARSNEPESAFLLSMSLVAFASSWALTSRKPLHLVLTGLAIALAFQQYMILAWVVWPAIALGWWFGGKDSWLRRLGQLALAGSVSLVASLLWIMTVWLTPQSSRPFIGNTLHNNPWEMVFGYNALGRFGNTGHMAGQRNSGSLSFKTFTPPFSGHPSVNRLFYHQVIGQISWLIPATVIGAVFLAFWLRKNRASFASNQLGTSEGTDGRGVLLTLAVWFAESVVMFSAVSGMHQYYTSTMAIPMALLVAIAAALAWQQRSYLVLGLMAGASGAFALLVAALNPGYLRWAPWIQLVFVFGLLFLLLLSLRSKASFTKRSRAVSAALLAGSLVFTPLTWSADAMRHPSFVNPMAGPPDSYTTALGHHSGTNTQLNGGTGRTNSTSTVGRTTRAKISHAKVMKWIASRPHGKFLFVTFGSNAAAPYLILKGAIDKRYNILPIGGFNGADPVPTLGQFKHLVADHQINYVLMNHYIGDGSGFRSWESAKIKAWVTASCHKNHTPPDRVTLYYCWAQ